MTTSKNIVKQKRKEGQYEREEREMKKHMRILLIGKHLLSQNRLLQNTSQKKYSRSSQTGAPGRLLKSAPVFELVLNLEEFQSSNNECRRNEILLNSRKLSVYSSK